MTLQTLNHPEDVREQSTPLEGCPGFGFDRCSRDGTCETVGVVKLLKRVLHLRGVTSRLTGEQEVCYSVVAGAVVAAVACKQADQPSRGAGAVPGFSAPT